MHRNFGEHRGYRGGRGRGRGGPRGGGIGGPRGSHYSMNPSSDDGTTFIIHPKSKFATLNITPKDVTVSEVGFYSIHGDLDDHRNVEVPADRSAMRSVALHCAGFDDVVEVDFDLDEGFTETAVKQAIFTQQILVLLKYIGQHADDPRLLAIHDEVEIVSTCTILADLMQGLYNYEDWIFGAALIHGKVVVGHVLRPHIKGITSGGSSEPRSEWYLSPERDHSKYWGRRFECYMTEEKDNTDGPKVLPPRFRTVLHTKLRDLTLLLASGVDAEDPSSKDPYPRKYVDFVTIMDTAFEEGREKSLYGRHMQRWWTNNVLGGTGTIRAGVHNQGHVTRVMTFRVRDLPALVKTQEREARMNYWDPDVCLGYLYALLKFVKSQVVKPHDRVVYEFTCEKAEGVFSCKEIPVELADGHEYAVGDIASF